MSNARRVILKLRPQTALGAAADRVNLRPLFDSQPSVGLGLATSTSQWYLAELPDNAPTAWDAAHGQELAAALGVAPGAVEFAEPDLPQSYPSSNEAHPGGNPFALAPQDCTFTDQHNDERPPGPGFAWHLRDGFSELASARAAVTFTDPRTRIAHIDTGYDPSHSARPQRILHELERNFVSGDSDPNSAADPNRRFLFDQSGHGTGTIGLLAGQAIPQNGGNPLGGAPDADILPLRIANSVVLFFTSAFAQALQYAIDQQCDVVTMSMGGLPSKAWNDVVNAAYEAGICIVCASGDCFDGLPTPHVVYPARYHRVIAACGVMANRQPYFGLPLKMIEGSFGPDSSMTEALAAFTPNTSWAKFGCPNTVDMDGAGTSSATPQIAAAAALWYENYKSLLPRDWRRVEAVRNALFTSADNADAKHFGRGILRASRALRVAPVLTLPKTPPDNDSFALLRVLTGLGLDADPRQQMLDLELTQRYLMNPHLQAALPDPEAAAQPQQLKEFADALIADTYASQTLRRTVAARYPALFGSSVVPASLPDIAAARAIPRPQPNSKPTPPAYRRLRTYAVDPTFSTKLDSSAINQGLLKIRWERLEPGPVGEYVEVVDRDADGTLYQPVNLDDPQLLAQDGFDPAEGSPQFHQQMVYAVCMTTIQHFEAAMGRPVLWRFRINPENEFDDGRYVQHLRITPHAFQQENAFYDPQSVSLRLGYFRAAADDPGDHVPGSTVFCCLSHDIVAHETTHAILDGMHHRFTEPSNPDVLAFHEGFADVIALMQHFTLREILEDQIGRSRGDLESETILASLASQFGHATGRRGALRDAIGTIDAQGNWTRQTPDPKAYATQMEPHRRGSLLVAALFDAFLLIYKRRTADLYRIYTDGTGVLRPGAIHPDLTRRLASEAAKVAGHILRMCVRALDYIPTFDITFGEYLRGIVTADFDLVPDDTYGYRVAFVEAFRGRGIYPDDLDTLAVDTLRWQDVDIEDAGRHYGTLLRTLKKFADECIYITDRKVLFERTHKERKKLHALLEALFKKDPDAAAPLGIDPTMAFEVHELRRAERVNAEGRPHPQIIVALTQSRPLKVPGSQAPFRFFGGATLVVDLLRPALQYAIRKRIDDTRREQKTLAFLQKGMQNPATALLLQPQRLDRIAAIHSLSE